MGLRDTLKRLMPGREEEKEGDGRPAGDDAETAPALPQIALPPGDTLPEYAEKVTGKRRPSSDAAPQSAPVESTNAAVPAVTGRRRASGASATRRPRARSHGAIGSLPKDKAENPTDYLYFGPGLDAAAAARRPSGGGAPAGAATRTPETRRRAQSSGCAVARNDDSGFLNTGVAGARQQMGYQNLTYGGSLQYDYSGTQAPF